MSMRYERTEKTGVSVRCERVDFHKSGCMV